MAEPKIDKIELRDIKNEIIMAQKLNEEYLEKQMSEAIERYVGEFIPPQGVEWDVVLNEIYPIIQNNLPSIFFRNPKVFLKPRSKTYIYKKRNPLTGAMESVYGDSSKSAQTQEAILNYILSEIRYKKETQKVLLDALLFKFGVLWHGYKGNFGMTEERSIYIKHGNVFVQRLAPNKFLKDPAVRMSNLEEARWSGRAFDYPLVDLVEDDRLTIDKKSLKGKVGYGDKISNKQKGFFGTDVLRPGTKSLVDFTDKGYQGSDRAKFVEVFEVFVRPSPRQKRDGEKGRVVLLTFEQEEALRVSAWPYKAEGWPAQILEFNPLNDAQFGLADIDTYKACADQKNAIVNLQLTNAQTNSKVWVGISKEGADEEDIDMVKQGGNTIVRFEGGKPSDRMYVASPGGSGSSELYLIDQRIDKSLQDKSGVSDLKKGFIQSGEESAASVKIRAAGGSARPAYRQDIMSDFLKGSCHFLNQLMKQYTPVDEAVRITGSLDIEWSDKPTEEDIQADTDVDMDIISMLPENPEKEIQELNAVLNLAVKAVAEPAIAQKIAQEGKMINISPIIENLLIRLRIRNPEIFRNIKPEESEGFVSVAEVRAARANVEAALQGSPEMPSPPADGQDHKARLEVYSSILGVLDDFGDSPAVQKLNALILAHTEMLQALLDKESPQPGTAKLQKPEINLVGE